MAVPTAVAANREHGMLKSHPLAINCVVLTMFEGFQWVERFSRGFYARDRRALAIVSKREAAHDGHEIPVSGWSC